MNEMAHHIRERFSDKKQSIDRLMPEDPEFADFCEDYDVCVNALRYWSKSKEPEAEIRVDEYRTLAQQIEDDVIECLIAAKPRQPD